MTDQGVEPVEIEDDPTQGVDPTTIEDDPTQGVDINEDLEEEPLG